MPEIKPQTLRIYGKEAKAVLGEKASMQDLQRYLSDKIAGQVSQVTRAENIVPDLLKAQAKIHISFSWG